MDGGAIYAIGCYNLTIDNCTFKNNTAEYEGAGIRISASKSTLSNCFFRIIMLN